MIIEIRRTIDTNNYINDIVEVIICHYSNYWHIQVLNMNLILIGTIRI